MPTTRAARRAAAERQFLELPADVLVLVLYQLPLAHDIALAGLTCRALCDAAKLALKARPFSGEVVTLAGHHRQVRSVAVAPDGLIFTGSYDGTIKVWRDGGCVLTIAAHPSDIESVAVLPGGGRLLSVSDYRDPRVKLWNVDPPQFHAILEGTIDTRPMAPGYPDDDPGVWRVAMLPDGVHFVVAPRRERGELRLYKVDGTLAAIISVPDDVHVPVPLSGSGMVYSLAVTPDGQHILSGSDQSLVRVWSVADKCLLSTCTCHGYGRSVLALAPMPDNKRFLSGGQDRAVRVWLLNGTCENTFPQPNTVMSLVALPDNRHALSGSLDTINDAIIKLFNVNDGAVLRTFPHLTEVAWSLSLLPDGRRFVGGFKDGNARIVEHGLVPQ